jgi:RHS repeat-associated protein
MLQASDTKGHYVTYGYDALGRVTSQGNGYSNLTMQYDAAGNRTRLTWPDNKYVTYEYDPVGEMTAIKEGGSSLLASFTYDGMGRRTSLTRGNGVTTNYDYDPASRLTCLRLDLAGSGTPNCNPTASGQDQASTFTYNAAGQITSRTTANDAYTFTARYNVNRGYTANSLNQYTQSGSVTPTYDVKGNLASAGGTPTYAYSTKNELIVRTDTKANFYHDPIGRLETVTNSPTGDYGFHYVDNHISDEYSMASGSPMLRRYVYGPGDDEPLVWYEGTDFSNKRYLVADERGSVVAVTDTAGTAVAINSYDEYGIPGGSNRGRFQYTGQAWLSELGMYSYKARIYSPTMGRFLQTDPAGYPDGPNWYNYVNADPVNGRDPSGTIDEIVVHGAKQSSDGAGGGGGGFGFGGGFGGSGGGGAGFDDGDGGGGDQVAPPEDTIVVTATKIHVHVTNSSPIIVPQVGVLSVVSNIDSPQKKDEKPAKPARTLPRLPDGTCPEGTTNGNRAGCLTPYGQEQQQQEFCAAISRPLYIGALFFGGPELLGGKALLESTGMRLLGAAGAIQGGICF